MDGVKGSDYDKVQTTKRVEVKNPMECPFNSECQCKLYGMFEGEQANECPVGSCGNYDFPPLCPLLRDNYLVKRDWSEWFQDG